MSHICIIVARFYEDIADELVKGAIAYLESSGITSDIVAVPGAFEIPAAVSIARKSGRYEGFITLGCVIRGETSHYDYVCGESARGLMNLSLEGAAIGYGILTVENKEQAFARAATTQGNKGRDAAEAVLSIIKLKKNMGVQ